MGSITAQSIIIDVSTTLLDLGTVRRWPESELLKYLNDGTRRIALHKPESYVKRVVVAMNASETLNTIPADGSSFDSLIRNMGVDGVTIGRAIHPANLDQLSMTFPDWHLAPVGSRIINYLVNPSDVKTYYVYPIQPSSGVGQALLSYFAIPPDIAGIDSTILLDDGYRDALFFYMLARSHIKESPESSITLAGSYFSQFLTAITGLAPSNAA